MNTMHDKKDKPKAPGKYWVVVTKVMGIDDEGYQHTSYTDCGYAKWDGEKWDRDDWSFWFGEAN